MHRPLASSCSTRSDSGGRVRARGPAVRGHRDGRPMRYVMDEARTEKKRRAAVFVERSTRQWVVLDPEGNFWILTTVDDAWRNRLPFYPTEDTGLDPVPGHYKHVLGLPF